MDVIAKHMVNRFLAWKLPSDFYPDAGISFVADYNIGTAYAMKHEPVGTNLLTYSQAKEMVDNMLTDLPAQPDTIDFVREWLMSGDHPVSDWERQFAAAIDARAAS